MGSEKLEARFLTSVRRSSLRSNKFFVALHSGGDFSIVTVENHAKTICVTSVYERQPLSEEEYLERVTRALDAVDEALAGRRAFA